MFDVFPMTALPLLTKELTEIAARRRTYVTRVVYALLLCGIFGAVTFSALQRAYSSPMFAMGMGREMFLILTMLQIAGIYLFLPAMACGLITQEKERDSLVLLFLTELGPWQILLQKYATGLVAIFSFLLIGMPLGALCYAYGGVTPEDLFTGIFVLFLTGLQVAAFALMCSATARTTVGAFIGTYFGQAALFFGLALANDFYYRLIGYHGSQSEILLQVFPFGLLRSYLYSYYWMRGRPGISDVRLHSLPSIGATLVFLLVARFYFVRRAFAPARNRLRAMFRRMDSSMQRVNRRFGGITFQAGFRALPGDDPIAWRELARTTIGRWNHLARILLAVEIFTIALCLWNIAGGNDRENLSSIAAVLGILAVVALSASAANAFVSERVNQTFEVLLTTPLHATDVVRQKMRMLSRFAWVLAAPVMTVFALAWWLRRDEWSAPPTPFGHSSPELYLLCSVLTLAVYLPLVLWLSMWIGLKMRTRIRAIVTALAVIVGWCAIPFLAYAVMENNSSATAKWLLLGSPLTMPAMNQTAELQWVFPHAALIGVLVSFLTYGLIAAFIRHRCLSRADRYLRS